jgi:glycolate oxidase iron-sulfur subunit
MKIELAERFRGTALGREAESLLLPCVQCGQCTFTCPTFRLLDDEWDGPRGRIYLISLLFEGRTPDASSLPPAYTLKTLEGRTLKANLQLHLDRCLTCRSCESSCPEGVRYGRLLDIARELVEKETPRPLKERFARRAVRAIVAYRYRFTALLRTGQALRRLLPQNLRVRIPERRRAGPWPERAHDRSMLVWQGCVQPALAPDINAAAARVLDRFGIRLVPADSGCCGALSQHLAATDEARAFMRRSIDALWPQIEAGAEAIVTTTSGCGAHLRDYGQLMQDDPHYGDMAKRISEMTRDIAEVVADEWREDPPHDATAVQVKRRIAFQSPCSLQHGHQQKGVVEGLLRRAGFKLIPAAYRFMCCGSAGSYSILQPALAHSLRTLKLQTLLETGPELIATANVGCMTHLAAASPLPVVHWIQLLDETLHASGSTAGKASE